MRFRAIAWSMTAFICLPDGHDIARADSGGVHGSLLLFPSVIVKWDADGNPTHDTIISLTNNFHTGVMVKIYFVNGDPPLDAVHDAGVLVERQHPGFNYTARQMSLDWWETRHLAAAEGVFAGLDSGDPPGRPDPHVEGGRILRGFAYVWAVNEFGKEIQWNRLSGDAMTLDLVHGSGWEYEAQVFRALAASEGDPLPEPGTLRLDGIEYEQPPALLRFDFWGSGIRTLPGGGGVGHVDTLLTLMPASQDLRQSGDDCITTYAKFDTYNEDGDELSGTRRCLTCWDQTWLSDYGTPNHFLLHYLSTNTGSAVIDGISSPSCGSNSQPAAIIGVAARAIKTNFLNGLGDFNDDGNISLDDYSALLTCMESSGASALPGDSSCIDVFDLDTDADVDFKDYCEFVLAFEQSSRSYTTTPLSTEGMESAIIRYDVTNPSEP